MESGGSFPERPWDFSLFACTGGSLGRGDPALPLAKRTGARVACPQSSVLPVQPASSVCKKLINTRCGSRTVAGPGASVLRSGQAMPHFVILRQLHNRVILVSTGYKKGELFESLKPGRIGRDPADRIELPDAGGAHSSGTSPSIPPSDDYVPDLTGSIRCTDPIDLRP